MNAKQPKLLHFIERQLKIPIYLLIPLFQKVVKVIDTNYDGKISKRELADLFFTSGQISPFSEPEASGSDT